MEEVMENDFVDAPDSLGRLFLHAVKNRDAELLRSVMAQGFMMGNFIRDFTPEDHVWCSVNIEAPLSNWWEEDSEC
jgi:hypothetical protein